LLTKPETVQFLIVDCFCFWHGWNYDWKI